MSALAGAIGGLAGAWAMDRVQTGLERFEPNVDRELDERVAARLGIPPAAIHYAVGAGAGAVYGILPRRFQADGFLFGAAVWAVSAAVWRTNRASLAAHLVYGAVTGGVARLV